MRVIDADEAKEKMKDMAAYSTRGCLLYLSDVLHKIDECQTLDADPVVHAHWIRITRSPNEYRQCSNCHGYFTLPMPKYRGFYMRYCPNCGAKMD
mgnify:FL=1